MRAIALRLVGFWLGCWSLTACSPATASPNGDACTANGQCASGLCSGSALWHESFVCRLPSGDRDGDGLSEAVERRLGTNPAAADSDGDGTGDAQEVGDDVAQPKNADGDGRIDAVEDDRADGDGDCLADPVDPHDGATATGSELAQFACQRGVCTQASVGTCDPVGRTITCQVGSNTAYELDGEISCDGLDNDCDGLTDEGLEGKAGKACAAVGVCKGAKASACLGGKWLCNFGDLNGYEAVEKTCDGLDNDCDGLTDDPGICADQIDCTLDSCDPPSGCQHAPEDKLCGDGNPCTNDTCDRLSGCRFVARIGPCDDGQVCTQGERCQGGACVGGTPVPCDDGNQCTLDHCDIVNGCVAPPLPGGSACKPDVPCQQAGECEKGACVVTKAVSCDDGSTCTQDACDPATGECAHVALQGACNDGNPCTSQDKCADKVCLGTPLDTCCKSDTDCTDSSDCTVDTCQGGQCSNDLVAGSGKPCDDGNACTKGESCVLGVCAATLLDKCSDGNPCTLDVCDPTSGCLQTLLADGASCDDGNVCNGVDACKAGTCLAGQKLTCVDTNPCTIDACDKQKGCQFSATLGDCNDGNACTTKDTCGSGSCVGQSLICTDNNPCTADGCDTQKGCLYTPVLAPCSDGNACTAPDLCLGGVCGAPALECDDGNACTVDACAVKSGCVHDANLAEGAACSDGTACTVGDTCKNGGCSTGTVITCDDKNSCTNDKCDAVSGFCKHAFNSAPCGGTACAPEATCSSGVCKGVETSGCCKLNGDCEDGNPCTIDACTKASGTCAHTLVDGFACDDGSKCTVGDVCSKGACVGGANQGCDDAMPCTADFCLPASGCHHLGLVTGPCSDGKPCNGLESCTPGGCIAGKEPDCNDGNPCTFDKCYDPGGCSHAWTQPDTACSDGSACTTGDICDGKGTCKGAATTGPGCCKTAADCDDGYACTADACHAALASCTHVGLTCLGANGCTIGYCQDGACVSDQACSTPQVYSEGFEIAAKGWNFETTEATAPAGLAWQVTPDGAAADGLHSLHCGYGTGTYRATLPDLGLPPGKYVLAVHARLDVDSVDCTLGSLQLSLGSEPLGEPLCASGATEALLQRPFLVPVGAKNGKLVVQFQSLASSSNPSRGAWIDAVVVTAEPDLTCACK